MKKILILLMLLTLFLAGCGSDELDEKTSINEVSQGNKSKGKESNDQDNVSDKKERVPITVDQVPYEINILEPDSIGNVYMEATYTNNTNYPITGFNMTILLKDKNDKAYLANYDTVMPGETSPVFSSFGPASRKHEDYEILRMEINADDSGSTLSVDYDTKLNRYEVMEY